MSSSSRRSSTWTTRRGGRPRLAKAPVELGQALRVAAGGPHEDLAPGEVVRLPEGRRAGGGDHHLPGLREQRGGERHLRGARGGDGEVGHGHVAAPFEQGGQQLVARDRDEDDVDEARARPEPAVQLLLEQAPGLEAPAALAPAVDEEARGAVGDEEADLAPLHQAVEVLLPGVDQRGQLLGDGGQGRRRRRPGRRLVARGLPFAPAAGAGEEPGQDRAREKGGARESLPHGALHSIGSEGDARGIPGILGA